MYVTAREVLSVLLECLFVECFYTFWDTNKIWSLSKGKVNIKLWFYVFHCLAVMFFVIYRLIAFSVIWSTQCLYQQGATKCGVSVITIFCLLMTEPSRGIEWLNGRSPRIDPCGTPHRLSNILELKTPEESMRFQFCRYNLNYWRMVTEKPTQL